MGKLIWIPEAGVGYFPVDAAPAEYGADYFARYQAMSGTPMANKLNAARVRMVRRHYDGPVVDIGIGAGDFLNAMPDESKVWGYDVNPVAVDWLKRRELYINPYELESVAAITCWDSLEHIRDFPALINRVAEWVFVSLPTFYSANDVLNSKHYRRDEHFWYFSPSGLVNVMESLGFECREINCDETEIGREGITSFAFRRVPVTPKYHHPEVDLAPARVPEFA